MGCALGAKECPGFCSKSIKLHGATNERAQLPPASVKVNICRIDNCGTLPAKLKDLQFGCNLDKYYRNGPSGRAVASCRRFVFSSDADNPRR